MSVQNGCSSLLEGHKRASKPLLKPASRLQWRSKSLDQYHCPKSLFADAGLCNTFLCSPLLLLDLPPCMDMHGFTLHDIPDDHIRGPYKGGIQGLPGPRALRIGGTDGALTISDASVNPCISMHGAKQSRANENQAKRHRDKQF